MIIVSASEYLLTVGSMYVNSVLNVKAIVGAFNQERALVGAFSMIVKSSRTFGLDNLRFKLY